LLAITNGVVLIGDGNISELALLIDDKVVGLVREDELINYPISKIIDARGAYVSPGFIDIHIHGFRGCDSMDGTLENLDMMSKALVENGVTGFLPTTITSNEKDLNNAMLSVREAMNVGVGGAEILGCHLEGPFINGKYKGAQNIENIRTISTEYVISFLDIIKVLTYAPELDKDFQFTQDLRDKVALSVGHSDASYEEIQEAINHGLKHCTHLFNAMPPLHHRNPGVVGGVFNSNITCELICDLIHSHPAMWEILLKVKDISEIILITDCISAGGVGDGVYLLGGQEVIVVNGEARLSSGVISGSTLRLNEGLRNFVLYTDTPVEKAIMTVTKNPAKLIKIDHCKGLLKNGFDADIAIFNKDFQILYTLVKGSIVWERKESVLL